MLIEFSVANYRSIKDEVTLSMVASSDKGQLGNTFAVPGPGNLRLLKSAAIYGANASGKTNVVRALFAFGSLVVRSAKSYGQGDQLPMHPFRLDVSRASGPTEFQIAIQLDDARYVYSAAVARDRVHEERLTAASLATKRSQARLVFSRIGTDITRGSGWVGEFKRLTELVRPNALFLSVAAQFNAKSVMPVHAWFRDCLRCVSETPEQAWEMGFTVSRVGDDDEFLGRIEDLLNAADIGICRIDAEQIKLLDHLAERGMPAEAVAEFTKQIRDRMGPDVDPEAVMAPVLKPMHRDSDGREVAFSLEQDESAGTRRLLALAGPLDDCLCQCRTLVIDEFEAKLHPLLALMLLRTIQRAPRTQVILTTHDSSLLDADLLRRDQIWFTEKRPDGSTDLYSLWDFRPRKDENLRKGYLAGRYGAVPFLGEWSLGSEEDARPGTSA